MTSLTVGKRGAASLKAAVQIKGIKRGLRGEGGGASVERTQNTKQYKCTEGLQKTVNNFTLFYT